ncbi:MAG: alkaline phosphatase family protein [Candidatus Binataceae bacterium]
MPANDPIEHVVVLTLENRSFDHMLGCLQQVKLLEGIPSSGPARTNDYAGKSYPQQPYGPGDGRFVANDPMHEHPHVMVQLEKDATSKDNSGFVKDYAQSYPQLTDLGRGEVMNYHSLDSLPALHALARHFTVCDHWFSSVPGPTWCNRLFLMSGTSLGRVNMEEGIMNLNLHWYDQPSLFDRLNERNKSWRVYSGDAPLSLLLVHQWDPENAAQHRPMTEFYKDVAGHPEKKFPDLAWIEPSYLQPGANDDHPPHDILEGEVLIASAYNALRANDELWKSTLLIVIFDEHGGFYDHVPPPATVPPDHHQEEYTFDRLGVRVPVILISPWVENDVLHEEFDHTSLLRYLREKWNLGPLGQRTAQAKTFTAAISSHPRTDTPPTLPFPQVISAAQPPRFLQLTNHQSAIVALSHVLESMSEEDPNLVAARSRQVLSGPQSQIDAAVDRVDGFLRSRMVTLLRKIESGIP